MANRHERRRATKIMHSEIRMVSVAELAKLPSGCAWEGCGASTRNPDDHGWSKLLLYTGKTKLEFLDIDPQFMTRDCVLCPEHARYLDENLLINIGGQLRHVEGSA